MGAKAWFAAYFDGDATEVLWNAPTLDQEGSDALVDRLFPSTRVRRIEDGRLAYLNPDRGEVLAGDYGRVKIVAHDELAGDHLSKTDARWLRSDLGSTIFVQAMHSVSDFGAFALWRDGQLVRAVSVSPDDGIMENIGEALPFEAPYWSGERPVEDGYPLPFHPLEDAVFAHLGFGFEGGDPKVCDPMEIPIARYKFERARWKLR